MGTFVAAHALSLADRAALFNACYADYLVPVALDAAGLERMGVLCDIDLSASRVRVAGDTPVGFAFLGVRGARGWIGGMGVLPHRRREGHGRALMNAVLDAAAAQGLTHVQLEVLADNHRARDLYVSLGFELTRLVNVWLKPVTEARSSGLPIPGPAPAQERAFHELPAREVLARLEAEKREAAPWQREPATLRHIESELRAITFRGASPSGPFVLYRPQELNVNIVELDAGDGAVPALAALLGELADRHAGGWMRVLNLPEGHGSEAALRSAGFEIRERQSEMRLALNRRT
jgi:GNAT superfamily N-acetyltransferase